jgi:hypothetical protein
LTTAGKPAAKEVTGVFLPRYAKRIWSEFIERLARENEKSLSSRKLDCCDLNSGNKKHGNRTR